MTETLHVLLKECSLRKLLEQMDAYAGPMGDRENYTGGTMPVPVWLFVELREALRDQSARERWSAPWDAQP